jgi:anti-sigma B factor antagonist
MSSPLFSVDLSHVDGHAVVRFVGELDLQGAEHAKQHAIRALSASGNGPLIIDLSELSFCDSSGLQALIAIHDEARSRARTVVLHRPQEAVRTVLRICGMENVFVIEGPAASS